MSQRIHKHTQTICNSNAIVQLLPHYISKNGLAKLKLHVKFDRTQLIPSLRSIHSNYMRNKHQITETTDNWRYDPTFSKSAQIWQISFTPIHFSNEIIRNCCAVPCFRNVDSVQSGIPNVFSNKFRILNWRICEIIYYWFWKENENGLCAEFLTILS